MKKIILFVYLITNFSFANAHSNNDLAEAMKEMNAHFKTIANSIKGKEFTDTDLVACESLQMAITTASLYHPDTANSDTLKIQYLKWMAELSKKALELEPAIEDVLLQESQELTVVIKIFKEMNKIRRNGHNKFKEDH